MIFRYLFPDKYVKDAIRSVNELGKVLNGSSGPSLGFHAIKHELIRTLKRNPDALRYAVEENKQSAQTVVFIVARNIAWNELSSGHHMTFGTRRTMTGDGLFSLFHYLTSQLMNSGASTPEEASEALSNLKEMIHVRFGN